ncbi:L,D-transpeptidase family protein [Vagococcus elongatus]|nr:L,D-transpeptidase family protein [Vagococcus elongatus]
MNKKTILLAVAGLLIAMLAFVYIKQYSFYKEHFLPKTITNGINISDMTAEQANKKLVEKAEQSQVVITDNGVAWKEISTKEAGVQYDYLKELKALMKKQSHGTWFLATFSNKKTTLESTAIDDAALQATIESLTHELEAFNQERTATKNASIEKTDNGFEIIPEVQGNSFDVNQVMVDFEQVLRQGKSTLELEDYTKVPTIKSDNADLKSNFEAVQKIAQQGVAYIINGQRIEVPPNTVASWINYDSENQTIGINDENIRNFVTDLGAQYNTSTNATPFNSSRRGQVSVPAGTYSWTISTDSEIEALKKDFLAGNGVERSPAYQGSASPGAALIGNTYVEIDLQSQHMYYYQDGALKLETDVVTGKPSTPTPTGVFYVWNKSQNETLRGTNDDGSKYAEPVSYWMPIDWTGVGIHDSPWQPAYGGQLWQSIGSHGCINTPPGVMAQFYQIVAVGTPVVVI